MFCKTKIYWLKCTSLFSRIFCFNISPAVAFSPAQNYEVELPIAFIHQIPCVSAKNGKKNTKNVDPFSLFFFYKSEENMHTLVRDWIIFSE